MHDNNLAGRALPQAEFTQELDAWVIPGCGSLHDFLQRGLDSVAQVPSGAVAGTEGDALVIRGFDNLLHYLDWLDAQALQASRLKVPGRKN